MSTNQYEKLDTMSPEEVSRMKSRNMPSRVFLAITGLLLVVSCGVFILSLMGVKAFPDNSPSLSGAESFGFDQGSHAAGYGAEGARVDSQITLSVPTGQADEVYRYLRSVYVEHSDLLKQAFPDQKLAGQNRVDVSEFTDRYFDTANLDLYNSLNSARHRLRISTTNPDDPKSGRELVQVKATPPGKFNLRTELKFKVKHYTLNKNKVTPDNISPIIKLVDKDERDGFKQAFATIGVDPYSLRYMFTLKQTRSRVYLDWNGTNIISFSVDEIGGKKLWAKARISSVDIGLAEDVYTPASAADRKLMWEVREFVVQDLRRKFPGLIQTKASKYNIALDQIKSRVPYFEYALKYNLI